MRYEGLDVKLKRILAAAGNVRWVVNRLAVMPSGNIAAYSITSSAVARSVGGMARPSALAVLRLMVSSNFVGS